ncbi:MAG TPA: hypothetical protein P5025_05915 [Candidatus Ratteibacteria bacterium]|nr:hypothetical protein [Candidatus Ratteibacteria bacterium]
MERIIGDKMKKIRLIGLVLIFGLQSSLGFTETANYCSLKIIISLDRHKIHEDEYGIEKCSGYDVYLSKSPLKIKQIENNAKQKARSKTNPNAQLKDLLERQFYEWYFFEDLTNEFKKFPYYKTTNFNGEAIFSDLTPGTYYIGAFGTSRGRTFGVYHNCDIVWYCKVEIKEEETITKKLNFENCKGVALDRNWKLYGGK